MIAVILILSVFSQLSLTTTMAYDVEVVKKQTRLLDRLNFHIAYYLYSFDHNEDEVPMVNYTRNLLHEMQNNLTKFYEEIHNENYEETERKVHLFQIESDISFHEGRRALEDLQKNSFSNFTKSLKNGENSTEKLAKLKLEKDFNEFLEAIKYQNYQFAVIKFLSKKNETIARDFVKSTYKILGNVDCLLKFTDYLYDINKKLLIYRSLFEAVNYKVTSLIEICNFFKIRMKLYYNIVDKVPNEMQTVLHNFLSELDKRIDVWLTFFTAFLHQDLIVKIKYHRKLYGPVDYIHNITYVMDVRENYMRRPGERTAILSCYPLDCKQNKQ